MGILVHYLAYMLNEDRIATMALDICFNIHRKTGPGLFESVYEELFCYEWEKNNIPFRRQCNVPLIYEQVEMNVCFKADIILGEKVLIEMKSVEQLAPVHFKQTLTYLKITGLTLGLLINFNEALLRNGIKRIVNGYGR